MIAFVQWLQSTPASLAVRQSSWLIPLMQTLHILANGLVLSAIIMIGLRVWGSRVEPLGDRLRRLVPWLWAAMGVLTATGVVLILSTPRRTLLDKTFQVKMLIMAIAIAATLVLAAMLRRASPAGRIAGTLAAATLLLWLSVTLAGRGRWIGNFIGNFLG